MSQEPTVFQPLWMLIAAGIGFIAGELCGDYRRQRTNLQQINDDLRQRLEKAAANNLPIRSALKEQRSVINDIHSRLVAACFTLEGSGSRCSDVLPEINIGSTVSSIHLRRGFVGNYSINAGVNCIFGGRSGTKHRFHPGLP